MFVAASSECFPDLSLDAALERLVGLEYTCVEIAIREDGNHLKPSEVMANLDRAILACRETQRLTPVAYSVEIRAAGEDYYRQFNAICKLAKATKVVSITVPAAELGTPFNEEIERLRELVRLASLDGVLVSVKTEVGRMTEDPDTAVVLCDNVKGLGITLDPTHYVFNARRNNYDHLLRHVYHVQLRDSNKDQFQVRIGQGEIEYGRLVTQLGKFRYNRALSVHIQALPGSDVDHNGEMRKMRLLLESLL